MDHLTSDLLTNWGLGDYVRTFCEGRIDAGTLRLLCNDEIIQLIPIPGDRARFKANLDNWKAELKNRKPTDSIFNTTANLPTLSCSELELGNASFGSLLTKLGPSYQPSSQCRPLSAPVQPTSSSLQDQAASKHEDSPSQILQGSENRTSTPIHGISQGESLRSGYVLRTLQSSHDGKAILNQGRLSGKLDETQRNLLVKLIIGPLFEKDPYIIISNTQLLNWALEVQELFPNESAALYYTPYISTLVRGTARNASGKLLRYVYNRRRQLREKGIIEGSSRSRSSSTSSNALKLQSPVAHLKGKDLEEEIAEKLTFLRNSLEPWHLVEEYWKATANYRLAKNYSEPGTLQEYFNNIPY